MSKRSVKSYLQNITKHYEKARPEWDKIHKQRKELDKQIKMVPTDKRLSHEGKQEKLQGLNEQRKQLTAQMDQIRNTMNNAISKDRRELEVMFKDYYHVSPKQLDHDALTILNADILDTEELKRMADDYKDNPTMIRMIGKKAKAYADKNIDTDKGRDMNRFSIKCLQVSDDPHLKAYDELAYLAGRGVGGQALHTRKDGAMFADAFNHKYKDMEAAIYARTPKIAWNSNVSTPSQTYYTGADD